MLVALLDRSVRQIAEAAADVRWFDRATIRVASDVWDNNLFPLFWAVGTSDTAAREQRAMAVLEWMADHGARRRAWMSEQAAMAGYDIESLLPPPAWHRPGRDYQGHVMTPQHRLTPRNIADLTTDYAITTASVRHFQVERAGTTLTAFLRLVADRRFAVEQDPPAPPALVNMWLDDVTHAVFDLSDTSGAILDAGTHEITISLGMNGQLRAKSGELRLDDRSWHLSSAGRRADAVTPPRTAPHHGRKQPPPAEAAGAHAHAAATVLRHAMWQVRSVRYAAHADHVPILGLCRAFSGAGDAILAAGSQPDARRRETAFRNVIRTWIHQGGPELADWFASHLQVHAVTADLIEPPRPADRAPLPLSDPVPTSAAPPYAVLTMAAWTSAHTDYRSQRPATAQLQLALPPDPDEPSATPWHLRTLDCTTPTAFHLHTRAFQGPGPLTQTGTPTAACTFDLHEGALHIASGDGWSAALH
ncbi:hypothetical protein LO772_02280 [Yinghuangia sp. ASG 101]|uniref:hypothetical protein n=1 Tax=Yinghuangia sp. ASG 101 TaxID=2896848 RepID=UPI001E5E6D2F|nr:hypothetical protein [Yinghuangia sp. ASG 101]UGQ12464.1 hypothetical protein LO772_02280 [Yinghuangia sp. ASG 101]